MNTNQTNALVVKHYDSPYPIRIDLVAYARANAPDNKARNKVRDVLSSHSDLQYARDMLLSLRDVFAMINNRSWGKSVASGNEGEYAKHHARSNFYRHISNWANACYDAEKEAPVITPDCPKDDNAPIEDALAALQERLLMSDFGKRRIDLAAALFKSVVLERPYGATVLDVLERFGDEAGELSWGGGDDYDAVCFWDACVQISDDLRSDLAADQIKKASTVTVPEPDTVMWEVTGDPHWALYRTKTAAERAAWELFPDEKSSQRYSRLKFRTVKQ